MKQTEFHHEAFFYGDTDEFLAGAIPFLHGGLEAGEPALVAVGPAQVKALQGELAGEGESIRFVDMEKLGRNPARIIPFWREFLDEHGGLGRPIRGIGEPVWPGRSAVEIDECQRHESLLNYAFWDGPAWRLLCPYDCAALDDDVLEGAHHSHSFVSGSAASEGDVAGADLAPFSSSPFAGSFFASPETATTFVFDRGSLHEARTLAADQARRAGLSSDRSFDLVAAVGELTANSVMHGGGMGVLSVWTEPDALVAEVEDRGLIEQPLTGRLKPAPSQEGGRGLWMANHLCDLVQIRSGPEGTTIRLRMGLARSA
jgi:anti-sigma regulatory factor (Ser/Thr protein kinase)